MGAESCKDEEGSDVCVGLRAGDLKDVDDLEQWGCKNIIPYLCSSAFYFD